jgi:hypothetical protein
MPPALKPISRNGRGEEREEGEQRDQVDGKEQRGKKEKRIEEDIRKSTKS